VLAERLELTPAAVRRHLDHLLDEGLVESREERVYGPRGRGRPAKVFVLTDTGRHAFHQAYDDLAATAMRFIAEAGGEEAVAEFARRRVAEVEQRYRERVDAAPESPGSDRGRLCRVHRPGSAWRPAVPAPLPGRARGRAVPPVVRGGDRGVRATPR
jgi:predicted ArsR family transcriptional regulator